MDTKKVGKLIKEEIKVKKISQEFFAERIGVSASQVSQALNGTKGFSIDSLIEISKFLDITIDEIIAGERKKTLDSSKYKSELDMIAAELSLDEVDKVYNGKHSIKINLIESFDVHGKHFVQYVMKRNRADLFEWLHSTAKKEVKPNETTRFERSLYRITDRDNTLRLQMNAFVISNNLLHLGYTRGKNREVKYDIYKEKFELDAFFKKTTKWETIQKIVEKDQYTSYFRLFEYGIQNKKRHNLSEIIQKHASARYIYYGQHVRFENESERKEGYCKARLSPMFGGDTKYFQMAIDVGNKAALEAFEKYGNPFTLCKEYLLSKEFERLEAFEQKLKERDIFLNWNPKCIISELPTKIVELDSFMKSDYSETPNGLYEYATKSGNVDVISYVQSRMDSREISLLGLLTANKFSDFMRKMKKLDSVKVLKILRSKNYTEIKNLLVNHWVNKGPRKFDLTTNYSNEEWNLKVSKAFEEKLTSDSVSFRKWVESSIADFRKDLEMDLEDEAVRNANYVVSRKPFRSGKIGFNYAVMFGDVELVKFYLPLITEQELKDAIAIVEDYEILKLLKSVNFLDSIT